MKKSGFTLKDVQDVYGGPEGKLWELVMGEQIHIGGWKSSMELAQRAGIKKGMRVLDLCSALGAGLRFLSTNFGARGYGLDGTMRMVSESRKRIKAEGFAKQIEIRFGDVTKNPWPDKTFDVIWGEDAWCYVEDKNKLVSEASRVLKKNGVIAFTDWTEGDAGLTSSQAERINNFMKFPHMESRKGYEKILKENGFIIKYSEDLGKDFARHIRLYIDMLSEQLAFDALKIIGGDLALFQAMGGEMAFMLKMAEAGKFSRARIIAIKA